MLERARKALKLRKLYDNWLLNVDRVQAAKETLRIIRCEDSSFSISRDLYLQLADLVDKGVQDS